MLSGAASLSLSTLKRCSRHGKVSGTPAQKASSARRAAGADHAQVGRGGVGGGLPGDDEQPQRLVVVLQLREASPRSRREALVSREPVSELAPLAQRRGGLLPSIGDENGARRPPCRRAVRGACGLESASDGKERGGERRRGAALDAVQKGRQQLVRLARCSGGTRPSSRASPPAISTGTTSAGGGLAPVKPSASNSDALVHDRGPAQVCSTARSVTAYVSEADSPSTRGAEPGPRSDTAPRGPAASVRLGVELEHVVPLVEHDEQERARHLRHLHRLLGVV